MSGSWLNLFVSRHRNRRRARCLAPALLVWAALLALAGQVGQPLARYAHEVVAHAGEPAAAVADLHDTDLPVHGGSGGGADHHGTGHPNCLICQHLTSLAAIAVAPDGTVVEVLPTRQWPRPDADVAPARPHELTPVLRRGPPSAAC